MSEQLSIEDLEFIESQINRIWTFYELCMRVVQSLADSMQEESSDITFDALSNAMEELDKMFLDLVNDRVFYKLREKKKESAVQ